MAKGKFVKKLLDMSHTARMARAQELGFDTERVFIHESPNPGQIEEIGSIGRFGGLFSLEGNRAGYYPNAHEFLVKGDFATNDKLRDFVSENYEDAASWIKSKYDDLSDDEIENLLDLAVTEDYPSDIGRIMEILGSFDEGDFAADAQKLRGELAKKAGYNAVTITDEFGDEATTMLLPGSGIRSIKAAFDPAKKESTNLLAGALPAAIGLGALTQSDLSRADKLEDLADLAAQEGDEESELMALEEMKKILGKLPESLAQSFIKYGTGEVGSIQAPRSKFLSNAANAAKKYNTFRQQKLIPIADMMLPLGELPEEALRKMSYGDKLTYLDAVKAALGML